MHTIGTTDLVPIVLCAHKTIPYRRIEQERIPMRDAVDELRKLGIPVESIENQDLPI